MSFFGSPFLAKVADAKRRSRCDLLALYHDEWVSARARLSPAVFAAQYGTADPLAGVAKCSSSSRSSSSPSPVPSATVEVETSPAVPTVATIAVPGPGTPQQPGEFYDAAALGDDNTEAARRACEIGQLGMRGRCKNKGYPWATAPTSGPAPATPAPASSPATPLPDYYPPTSYNAAYGAYDDAVGGAPLTRQVELVPAGAVPASSADDSRDVVRALSGETALDFAPATPAAPGGESSPLEEISPEVAAAPKPKPKPGAGIAWIVLGAAAFLLFGGGFGLGRRSGKRAAAREYLA